MSERRVRAALFSGFLLAALAVCAAAPVWAAAAPSPGIMIAAVSRNESVLAGGISTGKWTPDGLAVVEPMAWLSPGGEWTDLPCDYRWVTDADLGLCKAFAESYLAAPHAYTMVSAAGYGGTLLAPPMELSDCFGFGAPAPYTGAPIRATGIAASESSEFLSPPPLTPVAGADYDVLFRAFAASAPVSITHLQGLHFFHLALAGRPLIVVQRSFEDFADAGLSEASTVDLVFAIGQIQGSHFRLLFWKKNQADENEQVLGTMQLRDGQEFLVTSVNAPEAQFFRVYALENSQVRLVFQGGGYSC